MGECGLSEIGRKGVVLNVIRVCLQGAAVDAHPESAEIDFIADLDENLMGLDEENVKHSASSSFIYFFLLLSCRDSNRQPGCNVVQRNQIFAPFV